MKIKLYDEVAKVEEKEKEVTLRLLRQNGEIIVGVVDESGKLAHCGRLIQFTEEMEVIIRTDVDEDLGLPLDEDGKLIEVDE